MLRHPDYTRTRLAQLADRLKANIYPESIPVQTLLVSSKTDRISISAARKLKYRPAKLGQQLGPLWATYWFKGSARVLKAWAGQRVDLLWISHSEATLYLGGQVAQGLNHEPTSWDKSTRPDAVLRPKARAGERIDFEVEMACNRVFGKPGNQTPANISPFVLDRCDLARFDPVAWKLYYDFWVLQQLEAELSKEAGTSDRTFAGELLCELNRFANEVDPDDRATWKAGDAILKPLYRRHNATRTHEMTAIGHAHIDTAWLWPLGETHRKCQRTFSSQVAYMDEYPQYKFACSQAYQYWTMKFKDPALYAKIKAKVQAGQWVPVGGTWVEPDCNIPSGESLIRQFVQGQRFFEQEFGVRCREFWNPDVFGYNGQLPQIMRLAGITRFLTQKLSWNRFNKPNHHTFTWQGIDGSEVLAHFPPTDTYNAVVSIAEVRKNARDYKDHDRSRHSMMLFGYGDGGGGPTRHMLETLSRIDDLQGLPRTKIRTSDAFFDLLERDCTDRPLMVGELYFELHRGTYTTQAATKRDNRKCEFLLHDAEFLAAAAWRFTGAPYPHEQLDGAWKVLLLNQFHDILPGSSIELVYQDTAKHYEVLRDTAQMITAIAADKVLASGEARGQVVPVNTTSFNRAEVSELPDGRLVFVECPSYGVGRAAEAPPGVKVTRKGKSVVLENANLRATILPDGTVASLVEKTTDREALAGPGNRLVLYDDRPTNWDAWDVDPFHLETGHDIAPAASMRIVDRSPLRGEVVFTRKLGTSSNMVQTIRLDAESRRLEFHTDVDWHEAHRFLKVHFPVNVRAMNATYEMQFGCVERPTHYNTTHDLARFEVPGHKFSDLSEHGFGVALLSESKYGYSTFGNDMRLSLLRGARNPDPTADIGRHHFAYALFPHAGDWRDAGVVAEGYRFNCPVLWGRGALKYQSWAKIDDPNLVIDTFKKADLGDAVILRLYECHGSRGVARLETAISYKRATLVNALEEGRTRIKFEDNALVIPYGPFQIITVRLEQTAMARKILVLSASVGAGHLRAAQAVELALRHSYPDADVRNVDVLTLTNAPFRRIYSQAYIDLVNHAPHVLGYMYDLLDQPSRTGKNISDKFRYAWQKLNLGKFTDLVCDDSLDLVINTHFLPAEMIAHLRRKRKCSVPQVTVITDFETHRLWANQPCEHYFAATDDGAIGLAAWGVPADTITVTGIPIHPVFATPLARAQARRMHRILHDARPVVLQLAGGFGVGPIEKIFRAILALETPLHIIAVTGKNADAKAQLESVELPRHQRATVMGFTDAMDQLMAAADVVVSKPGGLTTSETLARGAAMCIIDPIPGQEARNSDYLLENGAAIKCNSLASLAPKLAALLGNPARLSGLRANALRLGHPRAAFEVVEQSMAFARSR